MKQMAEMWAFIADDPANNEEGIVAMWEQKSGWMPLVSNNWERVLQMRDYATHISRQTGRAVKLVKFGSRDLVEVITPFTPEVTHGG